MSTIFDVPSPANEPVNEYAPDSGRWRSLHKELDCVRSQTMDLPAYIGGWEVGEGVRFEIVEPHLRANTLGVARSVSEGQARRAISVSLEAGRAWRNLEFEGRASVLLRAAELLSGPWRDRINAATMLGQSKTSYQAEIDAACELADFWRFNVAYGRQLLSQQPTVNSPGVWNRTEHRPLEGFVYAVTPFNFTSIAGNLATAPALMGNAVLWKPAPTQQLSAHYVMQLLVPRP